jgi:tetratricopeptide (TPR) repeat protein
MNTNYAAALMDAHRYPGALAQFQKALERDPKFGPAHHKLAYLYAPTGDFADAVSESQKFVFVPGSWSPDVKGYRDLAQAEFSKPESMIWVAMAMAVMGRARQGLRLSGEGVFCVRD